MEPAGGDPGTMKRASRCDDLCLARLGFACLPWLGMGDPSALPAMKVSSSVTPIYGRSADTEKAAPSLLQGVLCHAVGR